jgi:hypothetical protein
MSNQSLAEAINSHEKSVSRTLTRLAEQNRIEISYRNGQRVVTVVLRGNTPNDMLPGSNITVTEGVTSLLPASNITVTQNYQLKSDKEQLNTSFGVFWKSYPKKQQKIYAYHWWMKHRPEGEFFDRIIRSLEAQKRLPQWTKDDGQFIPLPATWLNQERWDDEVAVRVSSDSPKPKPVVLCKVCGSSLTEDGVCMDCLSNEKPYTGPSFKDLIKNRHVAEEA